MYRFCSLSYPVNSRISTSTIYHRPTLVNSLSCQLTQPTFLFANPFTCCVSVSTCQNAKVEALLGELDITSDHYISVSYKKYRHRNYCWQRGSLQYFGHVIQARNVCTEMLEGRVDGRGKQGKPRWRWRNHIKDWTNRIASELWTFTIGERQSALKNIGAWSALQPSAMRMERSKQMLLFYLRMHYCSNKNDKIYDICHIRNKLTTFSFNA